MKIETHLTLTEYFISFQPRQKLVDIETWNDLWVIVLSICRLSIYDNVSNDIILDDRFSCNNNRMTRICDDHFSKSNNKIFTKKKEKTIFSKYIYQVDYVKSRI